MIESRKFAAILAADIFRIRAGAGSDNTTYLAQRERVYDGMRKAGIPEG